MFASERVRGESQLPERSRPRWPRVWILAFLLVFLLLAGLGDFAQLVRFAWDSASIEGKVVAVEPENHNRVRVLYTVNGRDYEMTSSYKPSTDRGPAVFEVGQSVRMYYVRSTPQSASLQPPAELIGSALSQVMLLSALAATFLAWLVEVWSVRSQRL
jgi:hypothetical protein